MADPYYDDDNPWWWVGCAAFMGIMAPVNLVLSATVGNRWNLIAGLAAVVLALGAAVTAVVVFIDEGAF